MTPWRPVLGAIIWPRSARPARTSPVVGPVRQVAARLGQVWGWASQNWAIFGQIWSKWPNLASKWPHIGAILRV